MAKKPISPAQRAALLGPLAPLIEAGESVRTDRKKTPRPTRPHEPTRRSKPKRSAKKGSLWGDSKGFGKVTPNPYVPTTISDTAAGQRRMAERRVLAAQLADKKNRASGWHNPITGGYDYAKKGILGFPAGMKELGIGAKNSIDNTFWGLARLAGIPNPPPPEEKTVQDVLIDPIKRDYAYRYGPLVRGHPGEFLKRGTETGFIPLGLDVASVLAPAARAGVGAGVISEAARTMKYAAPGVEVERAVTGGELARRMKLGALQARKRLGGESHELKQAAKIQKRQNVTHKDLARHQRIKPYLQATEKLDKSLPIRGLRGLNKEMIARNLRARFLTSEEVLAHAREVAKTPGNESYVKMITDPKVLRWVDEPTKGMQESLDAGFGVEAARRDVLGEKLGDPAAEQRRWLPLLLNRGAKFENNPPRIEIGKKVTVDGREGMIVGIDEDALTVKVRFGRTNPSGKKSAWTSEYDIADISDPVRELVAPRGKTIEGMIDDLRAEFGDEPQYVPDMAVPENAPALGSGSGGLAVPGNPLRRNQGTLQVTGHLAHNLDSLGIKTMQLFRWARYNDVHAELVRGARPLLPDAEGRYALPRDWGYVPTKIGERQEYLDRVRGDFQAMLDDFVPVDKHGVDETKAGKLGGELELTTDPAMAADAPDGGKLIVPVKYAKALTGEYVRSADAASRIFRDVTHVWRALVLNLRVAWLVNNIVGNGFLYAIHSNGIDGLRAYLEAVKEQHGVGVVRTLLSDPKTRHVLTDDIISEYLPELAEQVFYGTQLPEAGAVGRILNHPDSPTHLARKVDIGWETKLRRRRAENLMRHSPEFKAAVKNMEASTIALKRVEAKRLLNDPVYRDRILREVNDTLGDFGSLNDFEQRYLRGIAPFYAWYRAITAVMLKFPVNHPIRANVLSQLGQIGNDAVDEFWREHGIDPNGVPAYIRYSVPAVGDWIFRMAGINPLATSFQVMDSFTGTTPEERRGLEGMVNPLMNVVGRGVYGAGFGNNAAWKDALQQSLDTLRFLPEVRLAAPYESKLYESPKGRVREALGYLGAPVVKPNFDEMAQRYNDRTKTREDKALVTVDKQRIEFENKYGRSPTAKTAFALRSKLHVARSKIDPDLAGVDYQREALRVEYALAKRMGLRPDRGERLMAFYGAPPAVRKRLLTNLDASELSKIRGELSYYLFGGAALNEIREQHK